MINQLAAAHENRLIDKGSQVHITLENMDANAPPVASTPNDGVPAIKLQIVKKNQKGKVVLSDLPLSNNSLLNSAANSSK